MLNQQSNIPVFTFRELSKVIANALRSKDGMQTLVMYGPPGCGKTVFAETVFRQIYADYLGIDIEDVGLVVERPASMDATDICGMRLPQEATEDDEDDGFTEGEWMTKDSVPPTLVRIRKTRKPYGVLILDEYGQAQNPEQKALSSALDPREHKLGNFPIPEGWIVVATTNRVQDKAGSFRILSHNTNRTKNVEVKVPTAQWAEDYAVPHGVHPLFIECALAHEDMFDEEVPAEAGLPYCTKRSYTVTAHEFSAYAESPEFDGTIPNWLTKSFEGNIGRAAAERITQWIHRRDNVPTKEQIMADPEGCLVPDQTGFQLLAGNLAMAAMRDVRTAEAALRYITRLRQDLQVSLGTKLMAMSAKQGWFISSNNAQEFINKFQQFLPLAYKELN